MKRAKTQKGITLIALIITIVILMILAVVTIGAVRDNAIIKHAQATTEKHTIGDEKETIQLAYSDYKISKYVPAERTEDQDDLEAHFLGKSAVDLINPDKSTSDTYIVDYNGEEIAIKISEASFNEDTNEIYLYFSYNGNRYKLTVENTENALIKKLEITKEQPQLTVDGAEVTGDETKGWTIRFSDTGNRYQLSSDGVLSEPEKTIDLAEGSLAKAYVDGELKIGDTVAYTPEAGKSITVEKEESGASKSITLSTDSSTFNTLTWQVMDVNDATGIVTLIASSTIKPSEFSSSGDYLISGKAGYNRGPDVLDKLCSIFGTGEGATGARSLTVEDVNKVLKFDETKYEDANNGRVNDDPVLNRKYGYQMTYYADKTTWNPSDTFKFADGRTEYTRTGSDITFTDINGNVATNEKPITLPTTYYIYNLNDVRVDSKIEKMMLGSSSSMDTLLASRTIETRVNEAYWGIREIYLSRVGAAPMYWSNSTGEVKSTNVKSIRPVVMLEANILGEKDTNGVWQLK